MIPYLEAQITHINETIEAIDPCAFDAMIENAVNTLSSKSKIVVTGLGKNVPICEKFAGTMASLSLDAFFMNTDSAFHGDLGCLHDGDMLIVLSKSGETKETLDLVETIVDQQRAVDIWAITSSKESRLSKLSPHVLVTPLKHEGDLWNIVPINSSTTNLIVLQGLAMAVAQRMGITLDDFARNHPGGAIGAQLQNRGVAL